MRPALVVVTILIAAVGAQAQEKEAPQSPATLAAALKDVKTSLGAGLKTAAKSGNPISAKFEVEEGKLQLSVYTVKGDKFFEIGVDPHTGKVLETEAITEGEDLAAAKKQSAAMAKTKRSLAEVVAAAEKANPGFRAISVEPELDDGSAKAAVSLLKGAEPKRVEEKL